MIHQGDCLEVLKGLDAESVDSLVTDPPAGISFMGKDWDGNKGGRDEWIRWMADVMRECMRVLKPGAHGLVWALPRTSHWTAMALEDAGFEVRDCVYHLFGQGFPKSLDISKAIDKAAGVKREVIAEIPDRWTGKSTALNFATDRPQEKVNVLGSPATDAAKQWQGFGTALKPAVECWWLVRKPLSEKTVAANVLKHGTGGLNIDGSRIESPGSDITDMQRSAGKSLSGHWGTEGHQQTKYNAQGRFPSHLVLSHSPYCREDQCDIECAINALDEQSGTLKSGSHRNITARKDNGNSMGKATGFRELREGDSGGASRFFARFHYCAKISSSERNAGLEDMPDRNMARGNAAQANLERGQHIDRAEVGSGFDSTSVVKNHHPTVKPQKLMRYLIKLVTPPGGLVLDPFTGSGSTGVAAVSEGFQFIGIEQNPEYTQIAEKRIYHAFPEHQKQYDIPTPEKGEV